MLFRKDQFIVFLCLAFIIIALIVNFSFVKIQPIFSLSHGGSQSWPVDEKKAWQIIQNEKEVKDYLEQEEERTENESGILISRPRLDLDSPPTSEEPFWQFHLYELVINIPPGGEAESHTATRNWYQINARTGQISKTF